MQRNDKLVRQCSFTSSNNNQSTTASSFNDCIKSHELQLDTIGTSITSNQQDNSFVAALSTLDTNLLTIKK